MKKYFDGQSIREIILFIIAIMGFVYGIYKDKQTNKYKKKISMIDSLDIEAEIKHLDLDEQRIKREYSKKIEQKKEEMSRRGLWSGGIRAEAINNLNAEQKEQLSKIRIQKDKFIKEKKILEQQK